jgi:hypothetical protein
MGVSGLKGFPLATLMIFGLAATTACWSQTASPVKPATSTPVSPAAVSEEPPPGHHGATALCMDGTYFYGKPTANMCADHGGVRARKGPPPMPLIR